MNDKNSEVVQEKTVFSEVGNGRAVGNSSQFIVGDFRRPMVAQNLWLEDQLSAREEQKYYFFGLPTRYCFRLFRSTWVLNDLYGRKLWNLLSSNVHCHLLSSNPSLIKQFCRYSRSNSTANHAFT